CQVVGRQFVLRRCLLGNQVEQRLVVFLQPVALFLRVCQIARSLRGRVCSSTRPRRSQIILRLQQFRSRFGELRRGVLHIHCQEQVEHNPISQLSIHEFLFRTSSPLALPRRRNASPPRSSRPICPWLSWRLPGRLQDTSF